MNDINWHDLRDDESWKLIRHNPNHLAIIETEISWRIDVVDYIEDRPSGPYLSTACEKAIRFAFIDKKA